MKVSQIFTVRKWQSWRFERSKSQLRRLFYGGNLTLRNLFKIKVLRLLWIYSARKISCGSRGQRSHVSQPAKDTGEWRVRCVLDPRMAPAQPVLPTTVAHWMTLIQEAIKSSLAKDEIAITEVWYLHSAFVNNCLQSDHIIAISTIYLLHYFIVLNICHIIFKYIL